MQDPALWQEIQDTPIALAPRRHCLAEHLWREFDLPASRHSTALTEYRRFLYLVAVSKEPLAPSPLIDYMWKTHAKCARIAPDGGKALLARLPSRADGGTEPHNNPAYQRTLDLYQQEFRAPPMPKVWPSVRELRRTRIVSIAFFVVFMLTVTSATLEIGSIWLILPGFAFCFGAFFWSIFASAWVPPDQG